jgi:PPM family protein phosphatase
LLPPADLPYTALRLNVRATKDTVNAVGRSDTGKTRTHNEDSFLVEPDLCFYVVADGMGGHRAGEVASRLVVDTMIAFVRASGDDGSITWPYGLEPNLSIEINQLRNAMHLAHQRVVSEAMRNTEYEGMGSTAIAAVISKGRVVFANVGDSRLYLFRNSALKQLSADDSWAASMLRAGVDAELVHSHPFRHLLTSALGSTQAQPLEVEVQDLPLEPGDVLLLCSDGLYGMLSDEQMAGILTDGSSDLAARADRLISAANEAGGADNITVVLAEFVKPAR